MGENPQPISRYLLVFIYFYTFIFKMCINVLFKDSRHI